jgi:hypothetical protein
MPGATWFNFTKLAAPIHKEHVLAALAELDAGAEHPFGPATVYELSKGGRRYDPKAVVGLAYRLATGIFPNWDQFKGGPEDANKVLKRLGFTVGRIGDGVEGTDWTAEECRLIVGNYFEMLSAELAGQRFNKAEHNRQLRALIHRSRGALERKHMNVSAVMVELALPYIEGYKPNVIEQDDDQVLEVGRVIALPTDADAFRPQSAAGLELRSMINVIPRL